MKPITLRTVLTIAIMENWKIHQIDVNNAFQYGFIDEDVTFIQPYLILFVSYIRLSTNSSKLQGFGSLTSVISYWNFNFPHQNLTPL